MSEVVQYKKRKTFNIGLLIFMVIFVYILMSVIDFLNKKTIALYEVETGLILESEAFTGLILRDEAIEYSDLEGYVNYYFREGEKAAVNSIILSISQNENQMVRETSGLTQTQMTELKREISMYDITFNPSEFDKAYDLKNAINNQLLEYQQIALMDEVEINLDEELEGQQFKRNGTSGLIYYTLDGFENITIDSVTEEVFQQAIQRTSLLSQKKVSENEPLYKLVNHRSWSLVFKGTEALESYLEDRETLTIRLDKDNHEITGDVSYVENDGVTYTVLTFDHYTSTYLGDRFLDFQVVYQQVSGIKIPNSAIVTKPFYKIPEAFIITNGQEKGILKSVIVNEIETVQFIPIGMFYYDGEAYYIRTSKADKNDRLYQTESEDTYTISSEVLLEGVYDGNRGYAYFNLIEKLYSTEGYSIISPNIPYGLRLYDHIIIEGQLVEENEVIY